MASALFIVMKERKKERKIGCFLLLLWLVVGWQIMLHPICQILIYELPTADFGIDKIVRSGQMC